ncbi:DUF4355 domain-containing protein [Sporosarcina beigongshangi]|uniref:DUF4355 domain-containing protein n=1 Tax=Sporosarcina beigongshangi TaxID=2782538 RepID=UPI00193A1CA8|nr:DUF4355 domain-containing protein [Sporosarcina beigongshangi]
MTVENNQEAENEEVEQQEEVKTFTQEEVDKLLQSESDRRVSTAIQKKEAEWKEQYKAQLDAEKSEAEKLAAMSSEERYKAELQKEREAFESERKAFQRERLEAATIKELSQSGLPTEFAEYLKADDAESIKTNIDIFKSQWIAAIEKAVDERLKGSTPRDSNVVSSTMTKQEFAKLDYHKRAKLMEENPDLVNQLLKK